jgi:hypothetical protein
MKKLFILVFTFLSANLLAQSNHNSTLSLLRWLIQRNHIQYLNAKSNAAVFYDKNALTEQTLMDDSGKSVPNMSLKDFLSAEEIQICQTAPPMLEQTDWRKKYSQLKTKFVTGESPWKPKETKTIYTFSEPIYLNEKNSRVVIGEYFICGPACGRDDLLLCEFKNGKWQLIARAVIAND